MFNGPFSNEFFSKAYAKRFRRVGIFHVDRGITGALRLNVPFPAPHGVDGCFSDRGELGPPFRGSYPSPVFMPRGLFPLHQE